jgi:hypothetical protein
MVPLEHYSKQKVSPPTVRQRCGSVFVDVYYLQTLTGFNPARVADKGRFHLKPRHFPLALSRIRHPPKSPLLHQNESVSAARKCCGFVFVGP